MDEHLTNDHKSYQIAIKYTKLPKNTKHFQFLGPPKYTKIGIFGMKINHLATLVRLLKHNRNDSLRPEDKT
jgi:hypothetical protein